MRVYVRMYVSIRTMYINPTKMTTLRYHVIGSIARNLVFGTKRLIFDA